ncbi:MAG: alpha-amylase family glycosyl hydrolase [Trueperaceae bacterium]
MLVLLAPLSVKGAPRELHLSRAARTRYSVEESLFGLRGHVLFADLDAARRLAQGMNEVREVQRYPALAVRAGDLYAAGLIHELQHLLIATQREGSTADAVAAGLSRAERDLGDGLDELLKEFIEMFPAPSVERKGVSVERYLGQETDGLSNRQVVFEELLLLGLANHNPALERLRDLFDDSGLRGRGGYDELVSASRTELAGGSADAAGKAGVPGAKDSLLDLLEAPMRASPTSLEGQLEYIRREWEPLLGGRMGKLLDRFLLTLDVIAEERKTGLPGPPEVAPVLTARDLAGSGGREEYEAFSPDASWMPRVVLLAKSTYVWLDQLSRRYEREIRTLDAIPDAEFDELASRGFTGLWLIGLWERSEASRRIKHLRGQSDAVASAYALHDYRIAEDLGGEEAFEQLRERAWRRGIRLASDMVPNHVGIDGRWVMEHPDWFIQLDHSPYPGYSFGGPDLSSDDGVSIFLEDHYYDNSDAAVVFKRLERGSGEERFIYHGNDGTAMPWNDTAQLDYRKEEVREAVISTIIEVAKRFPIIRFDAAMTLAKQHVQRLWYPEPGTGGAIPSRAQYGAMSNEEFESAMPAEFWREVVDRVAREVPDTLLLAEAFWMMEGYFVRTLGMHRVYNSAFMNMLKREANAEFRELVKNVLEFDPQVLGRFVNFMNNPDEDTAVAQFGKDDKYFGVCTLMCTMPGLPMFGHGQVEGFEEKYGMEFRRARRDELPDPWLVERHQREIFPLLHRREQFAGVDGFRFYDFHAEDGSVSEDVIAYSNHGKGEASLVLYHNSFAEVSGRLHLSSGHSSLFEGLGLEGGPEGGSEGGRERYVLFQDFGSGLEHIVPREELRERGLGAQLDAFQYRVLLDFREVWESDQEPLAELCRELAGRGVPSIRDAALDLRLRPLFDVFGDLLDTPLAETEAAVASYRDFLVTLADYGFTPSKGRREAEARFEGLLRAADSHSSAGKVLKGKLRELETALLTWMALEPLDEGVYQRFRLEQELAAGHHSQVEPFDATLFAEVVPLILEHAPAAAASTTTAELLSLLLAAPRVAETLRFNGHEGEEFFDRGAFRLLFDAVAVAGSLLQLSETGVADGLPERLTELRRIEERSGYRVAHLQKAALSGPPESKHPSGGRSDG